MLELYLPYAAIAANVHAAATRDLTVALGCSALYAVLALISWSTTGACAATPPGRSTRRCTTG